MVRESELERIKRIQRHNQDRLFAYPNVVGVGIGLRKRNGQLSDDVCIVVFVRQKLGLDLLQPDQVIPSELMGSGGDLIGTDIQESGLFRLLSGFTDRVRPVMGGCSISPATNYSAGTGGGVLKDRDGSWVMLTCNHVVTSDGSTLIANEIIQPSAIDRGQPADKIGTVKRLVPIKAADTIEEAPLHEVDAALIELTVDSSEALLGGDAAKIVSVWKVPLNTKVRKAGRSTGLTEGTVTAYNVTAIAQGWDKKYAKFANAIQVDSDNKFAEAGDSGSLVYVPPAEKGQIVEVAGMLFSGAPDGRMALITPMEPIHRLLDLGGSPKQKMTTPLLVDAHAFLGLGGAPTEMTLRRADIILHRFHDKYELNPVGHLGFTYLIDNAAELLWWYVEEGGETRQLMLEALAPFLWQESLESLEATVIDSKMVAAWNRLLDHVGERKVYMRGMVEMFRKHIKAAIGQNVAYLFTTPLSDGN